jgi:DNA-binding Lrp family transcriptional regulator
MDAYVYIRIEPGRMSEVQAGLASKSQLNRAVVVVGAWDMLVHVEGADLATIATQVLSDIHHVAGVRRTFTAPVVPPDRVGIAGWGAPDPPPMVGDMCYVHIKCQAGAAAGLAERLGEMSEVSGVAVLAGDYDLMVCVAQPWEVASGIIMEEIHPLPGVVDTNTLVSIHYEEPEEDRDQFSAWT